MDCYNFDFIINPYHLILDIINHFRLLCFKNKLPETTIGDHTKNGQNADSC